MRVGVIFLTIAPVRTVDLPKRFSNKRPALKSLIRRVLKGSEGYGARSGAPRRQDTRGPLVKNPAKSQTRLTPELLAALVSDYEAGIPVRVIASKYGVHRGTVPSFVRRAGASLRTPGLSDKDRLRAVVLYADGLTLRKVAERFDVDEKTVRNAVAESGGEIRPRGRRPKLLLSER